MSQTPKTIGEALLEQVQKIADALEYLTKKGLPESLLILWIQKKTRLSQRDIKAVLDALKEIDREFRKPLTDKEM
jgi:siroheme synthase